MRKRNSDDFAFVVLYTLTLPVFDGVHANALAILRATALTINKVL